MKWQEISVSVCHSVIPDSLWPHGQQPTRLPCPWDFPGKDTGMYCHFLLQCMKVKSEREVAQSWPTLCDPMDRSLPGSPVHEIFQARVLEWGAIAFSESGWTKYFMRKKSVCYSDHYKSKVFIGTPVLWKWTMLSYIHDTSPLFQIRES